MPPSAGNLRKVLANHPDACAVLVTSPDYFGTCPDLLSLVMVTHEAGRPFLVDEAHGAHLCFSNGSLPAAAMDAGADACVQSAHKTLPALTQGAYLHLGQGAGRWSWLAAQTARQSGVPSIDRQFGEHVRQCLSLYQTSSPSLMIGASLDFARAFMNRHGAAAIESTLAAISRFGQSLPAGLRCSTVSRQLPDGIWRDPLRVVIDVIESGTTGIDISSQLSELGIDVEMADYRRLVLIPDLISAHDTLPALAEILGKICKRQLSGKAELMRDASAIWELSRKDWSLYRQLSTPPDFGQQPAFPLLSGRPTQAVPLDQAAGAVSAGALIPYPPGIALVWPGEVLTSDTLAKLQDLIDNGFCLHGIRLEGGIESLSVAI